VVTEPAFEDLTAQARIRDAALRLFGERGVEGTTIRDIARAAGVSGGLVRHHFGSKEDLRAACDAYALSRLVEIKEQAILEGQIANPAFLASAQPAVVGLLRYFARSMADGSPAAASMFDEMVDLTERWLAEHSQARIRDRRAHAAVLVAMELGALMLREQLSRVLGDDILIPEGNLRFLRARIDFYSQPLLSGELAAQVDTALDHMHGRRKAKQ
jgi:TetR/AcrR family transcriptional regulator, regulator of cefoperazone and chloramphenicol sensitivity